MSHINLSQQQIDAIRTILATKTGRFDYRLDYTAEGINTLLRGEQIKPLRHDKPMNPLYIKAKQVLEIIGFTFAGDELYQIPKQNYRITHLLDACQIAYSREKVGDMVWSPIRTETPDF